MTISSQRGAALLLFTVLMVMGTLALLFAARGRAHVIRAVRHDAHTLAVARETVLGFAVNNTARPGELVFPDRGTDGNYDGNGDCVSSFGAIASAHLLGRWPGWLEQGCGPDRAAFGIMWKDATGQRLWYAVSRNLTAPSPLINSGVGTGWLVMRGADGSLVADDVVFVLFAPGSALKGQRRTVLAGPAEYLDPAGLVAAYGNGDGDEDFIIAHGDSFNDRLTYMRKGDFFGAVTQRVAGEAAELLKAFHASHGSYPFPASTASGVCTSGLTGVDGYFPRHVGDCTSIPSPPAPWFDANWLSALRYRLTSPDQAELRFEGCTGIVYTLAADRLSRDNARC